MSHRESGFALVDVGEDEDGVERLGLYVREEVDGRVSGLTIRLDREQAQELAQHLLVGAGELEPAVSEIPEGLREAIRRFSP